MAPELRHTGSGIAVASFTVAINRPVKKDAHPEADFINCVAWDKTAELVAQYFDKGSRIGVEGRIQTRSYEDNEGKTRRIVEVVADRVAFIDKKAEAAETKETKKATPATDSGNDLPFDTDDDDDDDLPI